MNELRYILCGIFASIALTEAADEILIGSEKIETTSLEVSIASIKSDENSLILELSSSAPGQRTNPCQNGGTYLDNKDETSGLKYTCFCSAQFDGIHCEILITSKTAETTTSMDVTTTSIKTTENLQTNPCQNGGTYSDMSFQNLGIKYGCICPEQFTGSYCETSITSTASVSDNTTIADESISTSETVSTAVVTSTEFESTPEVKGTYQSTTHLEASTSKNESTEVLTESSRVSETSTPPSSSVEVLSSLKTNKFSTSIVTIVEVNSTTSFEDWIVTRAISDSDTKSDKKSIVKYASIGTSVFILILASAGCFIYYRRYSRNKSRFYNNDQI